VRWFRRRVHSSRRRARSSSPRPSGTLWGRLPPTAACRPRRTRQPRHRRRWRRRPAAAGSREAPTPADGRPASGPRSTPPRRTALPAIRIDARGQAALPAFGHHRPQRGRVEVGSVHLAGNKEVVNGAQRRRRQPGRPRSWRYPPAITLLARRCVDLLLPESPGLGRRAWPQQ
jgi:hypothetical protein